MKQVNNTIYQSDLIALKYTRFYRTLSRYTYLKLLRNNS